MEFDAESYIEAFLAGADLRDTTIALLFDLRRTEHWDVFAGLHDLADELETACEENDDDWWLDVLETIKEYFDVEHLEAA